MTQTLIQKQEPLIGAAEVTQMIKTLETSSAPQAVTADQVRKDLGLLSKDELQQKVQTKNYDTKNVEVASSFVKQLLNVDLQNDTARQSSRDSAEKFGGKIADEASRSNELLKIPLTRLAKLGGENEQMVNDLVNLKVQFDIMDPTHVDFTGGNLLAKIPFFGKAVDRYFTKFQAASTVIESLFSSLEEGSRQLTRDIETLRDDQVRMRRNTLNLQRVIEIGHIVDEQLQAEVDTMADENEMKKFILAELIFPLRQQLTDLQQRMIVNQQGIIVFEVLIRNNKELIRGVQRCQNVTRPALIIGVMSRQALANQKKVLDQTDALNTVTENLLVSNAQVLKEQGVDIHKRAAAAQLSDTKLMEAMKLVIDALNDIENFKLNAVGAMRQAIDKRQEEINTVSKSIDKMERANKVGERRTQFLELDLDSPTGVVKK